MIDQLEIYLVAFVLSLSHTQLEMLKRDQIEFDEQSFIYFSEDFIDQQIKSDPV